MCVLERVASQSIVIDLDLNKTTVDSWKKLAPENPSHGSFYSLFFSLWHQVYDKKANLSDVHDSNGWIDTWLPSFVEAHGVDKVRTLLGESYFHN